MLCPLLCSLLCYSISSSVAMNRAKPRLVPSHRPRQSRRECLRAVGPESCGARAILARKGKPCTRFYNSYIYVVVFVVVISKLSRGLHKYLHSIFDFFVLTGSPAMYKKLCSLSLAPLSRRRTGVFTLIWY